VLSKVRAQNWRMFCVSRKIQSFKNKEMNFAEYAITKEHYYWRS